jgi:hypothetical protein
MRSVVLLALAAALSPAPAGAQSVFELDGVGQQAGPNARAAQHPLGPNGQAAQRRASPDAKGVQTRARSDRQTSFASCAEARETQATPLRRGEPGYGRHLDRDGDGLACE